MKQPEKWDIYNRLGEFQGRTINRGEALKPSEYHLVVQVWICNSFGDYLIQKRAPHLKTAPGFWATTAGHVLAGEKAHKGAVRELAEELGIQVTAEKLAEIYREIVGKSISVAWLLERDIDINQVSLQTEEVSNVRWASSEEIKTMISDGRFYDYGDVYMNTIFRSSRKS